jgi:hypothetical protein
MIVCDMITLTCSFSSADVAVPSLKPFKDDMLHIGKTLVAIATDTEMIAEGFRREPPLLDNTGRYYRFNVVRGLEDIGLEEAKEIKGNSSSDAEVYQLSRFA